ncbi:MAG: MerR family transcriptional regulator [Lachnospiraceae bacterium]
MSYTIKEISEMLNIPATTLRYYEKEGLLPEIERKASGYRVFDDEDVAVLKVIECLKKTGMSIKDIRNYSQLAAQGDSTLATRYDMILERRSAVERQIKELEETLAFVNNKCRYYEEALAISSTQKSKVKDKTKKKKAKKK